VVTGDVTQMDLPKGVASGLIEAQHVLAEVRGIAFTYFTAADVVRHPLVGRIVEAYEAADERTGVADPSRPSRAAKPARRDAA
jgi:phosphate starvation-inducible PhoH-like protein